MNVKETNVYKLFNTKLPSNEYLDEDGYISRIEYFVDVTDSMRLIFDYETNCLLINDIEIGEITEEVAGELLKLVRSLGYTESH